MTMSLETYAQVMAEIISAGEGRGAVLARHGLDEEAWQAIDARWQAELSAAMDAEDDSIESTLSRYAAAFEAAQRAFAPPISLEQFARVTRLLGASGDVRAALAKVGVSLGDYVRGSEHWSRRIAQDGALEQRFQAVVEGRSDGD